MEYFIPPDKYKNPLAQARSLAIKGHVIRTKDDWREYKRDTLEYWHAVMGKWPPLLDNPKIKYLSAEHVESFTRHTVEVEIARGLFTKAYLLVPDGGGMRPAILEVYYTPEEGAGLNPARKMEIDWGRQLAQRGFVALSIGTHKPVRDVILYPDEETAQLQPLSFLAYTAANCHTILASLDHVDSARIGIAGHSMGGKWAMFASCLYDKFACAAWSDPGIVFDESREDVNYWEPWYLGLEKGRKEKIGKIDKDHPRRGAYKTLVEEGHDLDELHVLMAPRPFLVAGGSEDPEERWRSLAKSSYVYELLGYKNRVGMINREKHAVDPKSNEAICDFFEYFLKDKAAEAGAEKDKDDLSSAEALTSPPLRLGWVRGLNGLPALAEKQQSWFAGRNVAVAGAAAAFPDSESALQALAAGQVDCVEGVDLKALLAAAAKRPRAYRVIGLCAESSALPATGIFVRANSTATGLDDLKAARWAIEGPAYAAHAARGFFAARGMAASTATLEEAGALFSAEIALAKRTRNSDFGIYAGRPGAAKGAPAPARTPEFRFLSISGPLASTFGSPFPLAASVARAEFLEQFPMTSKRFLRAHEELLGWCNANYPEMLPMLQAEFGLDDETALSLTPPLFLHPGKIPKEILARRDSFWREGAPSPSSPSPPSLLQLIQPSP